jgi:hypothetical protein
MYCQLAALTTPTGGNRGVQRKNDSTLIDRLAYFFVQTAGTSLSYCEVEQGKVGPQTKGTVRLHLTSFECGSIFLSGHSY